MPGRRCMTCADPQSLDDGEVLRELERLALDGSGSDGFTGASTEREDGSVVSALRRLRRGGVRLDAPDELARGFCAGDPEAQAHVLREIKESLEMRVARADPTLVAPAAARAESRRRAADAEARAAAASARAAAIAAESKRRPVSALERLSGDAGLDARVSKSPREPTFDGLSTLRRLAGEPSDDEDVEDDVNVNDSSRDAPPVHGDASRFDADPGSETGSLRDWGRDPRDPMSRDDAKTKTNRLSGVSTASAYAAAADAAEAAARAYASRAEEARRARSAFLNDEAAARRAASSESPESGRGRLATSPDANDARRGFRGGTPPPADAAFLPTPRDSAQAWSRGGLSRVARLTPEQQDAVVWILGLGVSVAGASVAGDVVVGLPRATGIQAEMAKGALLCRLAETLEGTHLGETHRRPKVKAEATHNINKALAVFRRAGRVAPRYLWSAAELAEGDAKSAWGVLFDIRAAYDAGFEKSASKKNSPNMPGGRVRGRRLRVTPRVDARGGAYGDPGDVVAAEAGEGRLPRTPPRAGTGAPFRERNADVSFASRGSSATFKSPKAGASSGVASWRRAAPGVPLTARGLPSPLARAAAKVAAARAKRVARLMGDADRAEKTAKIRRAVAADAAATATRAAFEAAAAEAELEAAEEEEALLALEAAARADAAERAERAKMRDGAAGARFSRGGAVKGALSRDAKARAASARAARPDFVPSGYVSPNENARRRSRSLTRDRDSATRAERTRTTSPSPRDAAASENGTARRGLTFSSAAPKCAERADLIDVEPPRAKQPKAKETEHSRVASLARRAAETAALAGAVPVVFEYREGPLPAPPPSAERDEEVRAWLASLRLSVLPREEEADLLSNPLRNGTLLRDVMTVLVGAPPLTRRERNPRTLDQARLNVEKALAPLRAVPGAVPPGLTWSTEGVLKGIREHTFGLLWYVKRAALGRVAGSEARRREIIESSSIGNTNAREGPPAAGALGGGLARASTPARSRRLFDDGDENVLSSSSSSPPHYAGVPTAEGGAKKRSASKTTSVPGRVFQSSADNEKNVTAGTTVGASASESVSPSDSSPREYNSSLSGSEKTNAHGGFAPSLGYEALPRYSPDAVRRLEASTVAWLARTGLLGDEATVAKKSFVALCPALATGVALCDLVTAIEGVPVVGVFRNPKSVATAEANARRACERLARHKNMSRRFLFRADDVAAGVVGVLLGLLEDVRVFHDGLPPRVDGSKKWDLNEPYCPETTGRFGDDVSKNGVKTPETLFSRFASPARTTRSLGKNVTDAPSPSAGLSAEPSPVAGGRTRVVASVNDGDASPTGKKPKTAPRSPRLADAPEAAARAAAAALAGWRDGVAKDLVADDVSFSGFRPTISSDSVTSVGREHTWEFGSFPRTKATPAEVKLREERRSAARAARAVADAYLADAAHAETPKRKTKPTGQGGGSRELSTAARARAAERARKEAAAAHAAAEKKTQTLANERSGTLPGSLSRTRISSNRLVGSSASKADPETVSKPPRRPPRPPGTQKSLAKAEADAPPAPSPPRSQRPRSRTFDSSPNRRRPVRFVPPPSPEEEKRELREREALRAARWIQSLGVSLRRAGASIGAGWSSDDARVSSTSVSARETGDPFAEATRSPAAELAAVCADGTLLCELVRVLEKKELVGVTWRPCSNASRLHNVGKALAAMRRQPAMSPMHLWCEKDVVAADEETVVGLLGDMRACAAYKRAGRRG
jgi:hypothetical protein